MKLETIIRQDVEYMPKQLAPGILYVSEKYETAAHLCACGCGAKIRTSLGPTEWVVRPDTAGPSLWPSVGNWQRPCQSHYIIENGNIIWCGKWTSGTGRRRSIPRRDTPARLLRRNVREEGWLEAILAHAQIIARNRVACRFKCDCIASPDSARSVSMGRINSYCVPVKPRHSAPGDDRGTSGFLARLRKQC